MTSSSPEVVPPSSDPDAAVSTGSAGDGKAAAAPPADGASTSGLGPQTEQQGGSAKGGAPYSLTGDDDRDPKSDSGA